MPTNKTKRGKIPVKAAQELSEKYKCPMIVIFAIEESRDRFTVTTYGQSKSLCKLAADYGAKFATAIFNREVSPASEELPDLPDGPTIFESE